MFSFDDKEMSVVHERIVTDPAIMFGKPIIRGTRVTVEHIVRQLATGPSPEAIVKERPRLTIGDIRAAQAFATDDITIA